MPIPLIPAAKLVALASVKIVVLGIGAMVAPVFTLRLLLGGTGEPIRLTAHWLRRQQRLSDEEADNLDALLTRLQQEEYSREQARELLFAMVRKSATSALTTMVNLFDWMLGIVGLSRKP